MRLAVLQIAVRSDPEARSRALAEATARAISLGADVVFPAGGPGGDAAAFSGALVALEGDAALDAAEHRRVRDERPDVLVLSPGAESDLQAEAVLELAIGLSTSCSPLVVVLEDAGAPAGEPGHGGSAIVMVGQVTAEALDDDAVLVADVPWPLPPLEPRTALPAVPPILTQRLAHHRGERPDAGYLADLS